MSNLSKRDIQRNKVEELVLELMVIRSIMFKFGLDDTANNEMAFVAFVNELENPPVSLTGAPITYMGYRQMMARFQEERMMHLYDKITSEPYAILLE